jgi:hypothetical protein
MIMIKIINTCVFLDYSLFRLCKNGRCQNPEMAGICRNITVYPEISRNMPEFCGICRNITEFRDFLEAIFREILFLRFW